MYLKPQFVSTILHENSVFGAGVEPCCFLTPRPRRIASSLATSDMVGGLAVQAAEQAGLVFRPGIRGLRAMIVQFEQNPAAVRFNPDASICTCAGFFNTGKRA